MAEEIKKFYSLYNNINQEKLLTTAKNLEILKEETQFYSEGAWYEYDDKNNTLSNEKYLPDIEFPKEPKQRSPFFSAGSNQKSKFKWVS